MSPAENRSFPRPTKFMSLWLKTSAKHHSTSTFNFRFDNTTEILFRSSLNVVRQIDKNCTLLPVCFIHLSLYWFINSNLNKFCPYSDRTAADRGDLPDQA